MATKTESPKKSSLAVKAEEIASIQALEKRLADSGFSIERVDPKSFSAATTQPEEEILELLLKDGYSNPEQAFNAVFGVFGISAYANKEAYAAEGTTFRIIDIKQRINGGFNADDDWALNIVSENGENQVLTMERNPGRDKFLYVLAVAIKKFGTTQPVQMVRYDKQDETYFYAIAPAAARLAGGSEPRNVTQTATPQPEPQTIEGEAVAV